MDEGGYFGRSRSATGCGEGDACIAREGRAVRAGGQL